jgi:hypothetical protein
MTGIKSAVTWTRRSCTHGEKNGIADDGLEQLITCVAGSSSSYGQSTACDFDSL